MARVPAKPVAQCVVTIGYQNFILPADKGMKLIELMQFAVHCELDYASDRLVYLLGDPPDASYKAVKAGQLRSRVADEPEESPPARTRPLGLPSPQGRLPYVEKL